MPLPARRPPPGIRQRSLEVPNALLEVDTGPVAEVAEPLGDPGSFGERAARPLEHIEGGPRWATASSQAYTPAATSLARSNSFTVLP